MPARGEPSSVAYYLTFSCEKKLHLFRHIELRDLFVEQLANARDRKRFELWAYVVMPNHVHLLLYPAGSSISEILYAIKRPFSHHALDFLQMNDIAVYRSLEKLRGRKGRYRVWTEGGGSVRRIHSDRFILQKIRYIEANPVRWGLVERPEYYRWSSARFWILGEADPIALDRPPWL